MFDVLNTKHKFLELTQSIYALKNNFTSIQVKLENQFAVYYWCSLIVGI